MMRCELQSVNSSNKRWIRKVKSKINSLTINRQRFALFSHPLPLTVGDDSTNYQTMRKDHHQVGLKQTFTGGPAKGTKDTFGHLISNAIGDPYVEPGKYHLRGGSRPQTSQPCFRPNGGHKLIKNSEFKHMHNGPPPKKERQSQKNFLARSTRECFQKKIPYLEDQYERKEDFARDTYLKSRQQILYDRPYTTSVRQRGTFYSQKITYGTDRDFPNKKPWPKGQPLFGPFKNGDPAHTGYNKTIGKDFKYSEEKEQDEVAFRSRDLKTPIWRPPTRTLTEPHFTITHNFKNINKDKPSFL